MIMINGFFGHNSLRQGFFRWALLIIVLCSVCMIPAQAKEDQIVVRDFKLYQGESASKLIADIRFGYQLTQYLRDSLLNGITLRNEIRFDLVRHSDWWWNETDTLDKIVIDLKYDALSRQYQLINIKNSENWNFSNLAAALEHIGIVKKYRLPTLPQKAFEGNAALYIEATLTPKASKSLGIPTTLSSLFSKDEHTLVSQGVMWPLTP